MNRLFALPLMAALIGAGAPAMAADMPTVHLAQGQFGAGVGQLAYTIAQTKGFFTQAGVRVEQVKINGANAAGYEQGVVPAIERGGPADIASVPNGQFVQVVLNGSDAIGIASENANPVYSLIVKPEIKSFADLKGTQLTLTAPWDNITLSTRELLKAHGLKESDYTFKSIGGTEGRMMCLKSGECSAAILGQPSDIDAVKMGYRRLGVTNETGGYIFNMVVVTRAWAEKNRDTLIRYLRADAAAMRYIHAPENRAEIAEVLAQLTNEPSDAVDQMMANIENPKRPALTKEAEINMADFRHVLALVKEFKLTQKPLPPAEHFVDLSYAKEAGIN